MKNCVEFKWKVAYRLALIKVKKEIDGLALIKLKKKKSNKLALIMLEKNY